MPVATLGKNGRITIPADVRKALGAKHGDRLHLVEITRGGFELIAAPDL